MIRKITYKDVKDFLFQHKEWIRREMSKCSYGIGRKDSGDFTIAIRSQKITDELAEKIEELRIKAEAEGIELDVREIGAIRPR